MWTYQLARRPQADALPHSLEYFVVRQDLHIITCN